MQFEDRLVNPAVLLAVVVVGLEESRNLNDGIGVDQQGTEDGLLGFQVGRNDLIGLIHGQAPGNNGLMTI